MYALYIYTPMQNIVHIIMLYLLKLKFWKLISEFCLHNL